MRYLATASLLLATPFVASAQTSTSLSITNFNFETGGLADGASSNNPGVIPTGWTAIPTGAPSGNYFGYFNPTNSAYLNTTGSPGTTGTMSGPNIFYFGSSTTGQGIQQTLGTNFSLNTSYTLTTAIGCRVGNAPSQGGDQAGITMNLFAGSVLLATGTFDNNANPGTFSDYSISYTGINANANLVGQALTISFTETDPVGSTALTVAEADMDNVRLTSSGTVPEPSTWMGGLGLLAAAAWCWSRARLAGRVG